MKKMQNEPNLKNTKMNLNLFKTTNYSIFRLLQRRKNEPNSNPICRVETQACVQGAKTDCPKQTQFMQKNTKKYEKVPVLSLSKYNFSQLFTTLQPLLLPPAAVEPASGIRS